MLSPLPRRSHWRYYIAHPSSGISLPRYGSRVGLRIVLFEACLAFTRVTACTLALSPCFVTRFTRRLQPCRHLHDCSGCFRLERSPGGPCTHWKAPPFTAHTHGGRSRPPRHHSNADVRTSVCSCSQSAAGGEPERPSRPVRGISIANPSDQGRTQEPLLPSPVPMNNSELESMTGAATIFIMAGCTVAAFD